jgi:hypothetical protein
MKERPIKPYREQEVQREKNDEDVECPFSLQSRKYRGPAVGQQMLAKKTLLAFGRKEFF